MTIMPPNTAHIRHQSLFCYPQPEPICLLDSPNWFIWLETAMTFRYFSDRRQRNIRGFGPLYMPISLRKEQRRHHWYWYAYRRTHGTLHKRYAGKSDALTTLRLENMATELNQVW